MSKRILKSKYPQFKSEFADVNNIKLHYIKAGPEEGKLIIFLHGFPQFWYMWRNQLLDFSKDYLAVAPDMRGYNLSSKPKEIEQYQTHYMVEDLRTLVEDHFGRESFILVGHDWGGVVAYPFANRHPNLVEKLIIINAPHPNVFAKLLAKNKDQQKSSQYVLFFRSNRAEEMLSINNYSNLINIIKTEDMVFTDDDTTMYIDAWSQPGSLTGGLNYYRAASMIPPAQGEKINQLMSEETFVNDTIINVPTLVIWAEKDTALTVHNLEGLDEYIPDLTIKRIPNGSHWVINEQPTKINELIRDFI
ncbi:MAG: alpha/beta fold hydrolase [Promethearchaeota archaeon]